MKKKLIRKINKVQEVK